MALIASRTTRDESPIYPGQLFLLISFQFSFFLWTLLGLFLLFLFAFIPLTLITHINIPFSLCIQTTMDSL